MGRRTYSREFKVSAVGLVQQRGYTTSSPYLTDAGHFADAV